MGWTFRKSVGFGAFRLNLSSRGLGVSAGVPGLRVSTGPRGNYIRLGGAGLHYRARLGSAARSVPEAPRPPAPPPFEMPTTLTEIESGDVSGMTESSSEDLLAEIARKQGRVRFSVLLAWLGGPTLLLLWGALPSWLAWLLAASLCIGYFQLRRVDVERKTVVLEYAFDEPQSEAWAAFERGFEWLVQSRAVWHLEARGHDHDWKRSGGATQSVRRARVQPVRALPRYFRSNVIPGMLPVGRQGLYFFPDRLLVFDGARVGAVAYADLSLESGTVNFVEDGSVPADATITGHTWRYVNKGGGPDRRFADNRQIPVAVYGRVHFTSPTGLNEEVQASLKDACQSFASGVLVLGDALRMVTTLPQSTRLAASSAEAPALKAAPYSHVPQVAEAAAIAVGPGPDGFRFDIVGESHYQDTLLKIADGRLRGREAPGSIVYRIEVGAEGDTVVEHREVAPITFSCRIVPEPTNSHDRNAIRVDAAGYGTVGYFAREDAVRYRALARQLIKQGVAGCCDGALFGGWDEDVSIGVRLSILPPQTWDPSMPEHRNAPTLRQAERAVARRIAVGPNPKGFTLEVSAEHYCRAMTRKVDGGRIARGEAAVFEALLIPQEGADGAHEVIVHADGHGVIGKLPTATVNRYVELWSALDKCDAVAACQGVLFVEGNSADGPWLGAKLCVLPPKKAAAKVTAV